MTELTRDELLVLLIEECGEVIQAATKCLRFGYDVDHGTGYGNNKKALSREVGDLIGVAEALPLNFVELGINRMGKIRRAEHAKAQFGLDRCPACDGTGRAGVEGSDCLFPCPVCAAERAAAAARPVVIKPIPPLGERCPTCNRSWELFPPAKISGEMRVRCVECKDTFDRPDLAKQACAAKIACDVGVGTCECDKAIAGVAK